jgi:hypothetical protein
MQAFKPKPTTVLPQELKAASCKATNLKPAFSHTFRQSAHVGGRTHVQGLENPLLPHAGLLHQDVGNQCHAETEKRDCENSFLTPFSVRPGFGCAIELGPDELGRAGLPNRAE